MKKKLLIPHGSSDHGDPLTPKPQSTVFGPLAFLQEGVTTAKRWLITTECAEIDRINSSKSVLFDQELNGN